MHSRILSQSPRAGNRRGDREFRLRFGSMRYLLLSIRGRPTTATRMRDGVILARSAGTSRMRMRPDWQPIAESPKSRNQMTIVRLFGCLRSKATPPLHQLWARPDGLSLQFLLRQPGLRFAILRALMMSANVRKEVGPHSSFPTEAVAFTSPAHRVPHRGASPMRISARRIRSTIRMES